MRAAETPSIEIAAFCSVDPMPELPEVEHLRRSLEPTLLRMCLGAVTIRRASVITLADEIVTRKASLLQRARLSESRIRATHRHGKQLAFESQDGRVLVVQLGMTGSVTFEQGPVPRGVLGRHRHVTWQLEDGSRMVFRDPRRFGGLTAYGSLAALRAAWSRLGPDALTIAPNRLFERVHSTARPIKTALLDQAVLAGVGNIYADESLFSARIHPCRPASSLTEAEVVSLARAIRLALRRAVTRGGSTLRDYRDALGRAGTASQDHAVYGRKGMPCKRCGGLLEGAQFHGRATVWCACCQDLSTSTTRTRARPKSAT